MRDALIRILNEYISNKAQPFADNALADFLRHGAPDEIRRVTYLTSKYLVKGAAGQGNWAEIPWICVFDKDITTSAQEGYYIVYLFDANMEAYIYH